MRTPHSEYLRLGGTEVERLAAYRDLFRYQVDAPLLTEVRLALNQGLVLGNERFYNEVEPMLGKRMRSAKAGRPGRDRESSADGVVLASKAKPCSDPDFPDPDFYGLAAFRPASF